VSFRPPATSQAANCIADDNVRCEMIKTVTRLCCYHSAAAAADYDDAEVNTIWSYTNMFYDLCASPQNQLLRP